MSAGHWSLEPGQVIPVLALAFLYWMRTRTLAARGRPVSALRRACFHAGLAVGLASLVTPIDWLGENRLLWAHMVQHLLLGDIAPLLVVLGCTRAVLRPLLAARWTHGARWLLHPLVALPLWVVDLCVWHLPGPYQAALANDGVHALEHMCFAACGAFMWAAVLEPLPGPEWFGNGAKAVYTLLVRTAGTAVAMIFIWDNHVLYEHYVPLERMAHIAPLTDQHIAGLIMFTEGGVVTMIAFAWAFLALAREMEVRQRLVEQRVEPVAAARAARYGRSARAREAQRRIG